MKRFIPIISMAVLAAATLSAGEAQARIMVGGGVVIGTPYYAYPPYYGYPYYAYPPAPAPYPAYSEPYPLPPPQPNDRYYQSDEGYCREFTRTIIIDGQRQKGYGHACKQQDGSWKIVD